LLALGSLNIHEYYEYFRVAFTMNIGPQMDGK